MSTESKITMDKEEACRIISENKRQIDQLIQDCVNVAEKSGVSFMLSVKRVRNVYVPKNAVKVEETDETEGVYLDERGDPIYGYGDETPYPGGWQRSMC
jgi:hypothetical protein